MKALTHKLAIPLLCIAIGIAGLFGGFVDSTAEAETTYLVKIEKPKKESQVKWRSIGKCRITEYCPCCNDPAGYQSSSGKRLEEGDAACSWLENGTQIRVRGRVYTIVDTCGTEAIDLFVDTDECWCDRNECQEVEIREE